MYNRIIGVNELNDIVVVDGMSNRFYNDYINEGYISKSIDFYTKVSKGNITYIALPGKNANDRDLFGSYDRYNTYDILNSYYSFLENKNIDFLDLHNFKNDTPIAERYYKSDHHWKSEYAFMTLNPILEKIASTCGANIDNYYIDESNYEKITKKKCFLGTYGKRTGRLFTGMDDFSYYTPKFDTKFKMNTFLKNTEDKEGNFESVFFQKFYVNKPSYYVENMYDFYMGHDYKYAQIINENAKNDKKIMLLVDSYSKSLIPYICFQFKNIMTIDLRYVGDINLQKCYDDYSPDRMIILYSPFAFREVDLFRQK